MEKEEFRRKLNKINKYLVKTILIELSIVAEVKSLHNSFKLVSSETKTH